MALRKVDLSACSADAGHMGVANFFMIAGCILLFGSPIPLILKAIKVFKVSWIGALFAAAASAMVGYTLLLEAASILASV
jgi:hypothetical protein